MKSKIFNKTAQGITSLVAIIILLFSMLSITILYESGITANAVKEITINNNQIKIQIKEVDDINELNQLNEGWYEVRNGYVHYLDTFTSYVPLYIKVKNPEQQNVVFVVDADGNIKFEENFDKLVSKEIIETKNEESTQNFITGAATGLERVSGLVVGDLNELARDLKSTATSTSAASGTQNFIVTFGRKPDKIYFSEKVSNENAAREALKKVAGDIPQDVRFYSVSTKELAKIKESNPQFEPATGLIKLEKDYQGAIFYDPQNKKYLDSNKKSVIEIRRETTQKGTIQSEVVIEDNLNTKISEIEIFNPSGQSERSFKIPTTQISKALGFIKSDYTAEQGDNQVKFTKTSGTGTTNERKEEIVIYVDGKIETTTQNGLGINTRTTKTITHADRSTISIEGEKGSTIQNIETNFNSITYTFEGRSLKVEKPVYDTLQENQRVTVFRQAVVAGITNLNKQQISKIDDTIILGDKSGTNILVAVNLIIQRNGEKIVSYVDSSQPNTRVEVQGSGSFVKNYIVYEKNTIENFYVKDEKGEKLDKRREYLDLEGDTQYVVESQYLPDGKVSIAYGPMKLIDRKFSQKDRGYITQEITDQSSSFYRNIVIDVPNSEQKIYIQRGLISNSVLIPVTEPDQKVTYISVDSVPKECQGGSCIISGVTYAIDSQTLAVARETNPIMGHIVQSYAKREELEGKPPPSQESSQSFFATFERILSEFRGLGYYATLFFDEDSLLAWRDTVDRAFAIVYLGTEYWSSALCSQYIDGEDEGVAYAETPQGLAQIGAHIEATRTEQIFTDKGREFIYKITFSIRNGDYAKDQRAPEEMNFNVVLKGERRVNLFKQEQKVKRGSTFSRVGRTAIVQDSNALFTQVCVRFDEIPLRWKLDDKELCNTIVEAAGEAAPLTTTSPTTTPSGVAPEDEINDF